ncbi:MAG: aminodeoxychorismate lyase [Rhodospirillaceae bacterium]|nr:aminodeoxychorismate lyase [Rhodospirillaceae bacterium]
MWRVFLRIVAALALLLVLAAGAGAWFTYRFISPGPLEAEATVVLPHGTGLRGIADRLAEAGVIEDPKLFLIGVRAFGRDQTLKAGEYRFEPGMSGRAVMDHIISGATVVRKLTIPEGLTVQEVLALVDGAEALDGDIETVPEEGRLLPETYHYSWGDSREQLVERMRAAMDETLSALWEGRAADLPLETPEEALTLASIVEKETALPEERPRVAAVFLNRLKRGMRLQSDPTVIYGLTNGDGPLDRSLTRTDLETETPYNTYAIAGLPPHPIANPGKTAISAVLNPIESNELYFVADGTGGHAFASSLKEHNRNVAKWRKVQRERAKAESQE